MNRTARLTAAKRLLALARDIQAADADGDGVEDDAFAARVRTLKTQMNKLSQKKTRKLKQYGIAMIRPTSTVEELVGALEKVLAEG